MNRSSTDAGLSKRRAQYVGIVLVTLAAAFWSLNGALIKIVCNNGQGPDGVTIAFYRSLFAGLFLLPLARGGWRSLVGPDAAAKSASENPLNLPSAPAVERGFGALSEYGFRALIPRPAALWCVFFFTLMTAFFVVANTMTEAANVIILQYTSTFWVFVLSPMILRERPGSRDLWILALALAGIGIIFAGKGSADIAGLAIALASGLFYALLTLMIRQLRNSNPGAVTVLNNLGSAALLVPVVLYVGDPVVSMRSFLLLVLMGVVQFGIPYYLYTLGLARVPAYQAALVTMLEPVLVPIWAYLAVGEEVPRMTMIGGGVVLIALLLFVNASRCAGERVTRDPTL